MSEPQQEVKASCVVPGGGIENTEITSPVDLRHHNRHTGLGYVDHEKDHH